MRYEAFLQIFREISERMKGRGVNGNLEAPSTPPEGELMILRSSLSLPFGGRREGASLSLPFGGRREGAKLSFSIN